MTDTRSHTNIASASPGPWKFEKTHTQSVHGSSVVGFVVNDKTNIADVVESYNMSTEEAEANARLIAAAPKLLAELKDAVQNCPRSVLERDSGHRIGCNAPCWQAAIDEAEGRSDD